MNDGTLPPQFDAAVDRWRMADHYLREMLGRYGTAPNAVNRLAVTIACAAIDMPLDELGGWAALHPRSPAVEACARAQASWEELHWEMERAGLLKRWGATGIVPRN
jgi:hypothetical protein